MRQKLQRIEYFIEFGAYHVREDTPSEIIHMSENYLSAAHCLTRQATWSRTPRVCWTLSILIFEISSREGALGSFVRVNIGSSGLTLIAWKGTNVILIAILGQRTSLSLSLYLFDVWTYERNCREPRKDCTERNRKPRLSPMGSVLRTTRKRAWRVAER